MKTIITKTYESIYGGWVVATLWFSINWIDIASQYNPEILDEVYTSKEVYIWERDATEEEKAKYNEIQEKNQAKSKEIDIVSLMDISILKGKKIYTNDNEFIWEVEEIATEPKKYIFFKDGTKKILGELVNRAYAI